MIGYASLLLLGLILISVPVAVALFGTALGLSALFSSMPLHLALAELTWQNSIEFLLVAIPLFVLLGELFVRTGIAGDMYGAMAQWLSWLPGGLMHANIGSCALFAATSGSSVATAATIGTIALPEASNRGYNERLFLGTIAAGGTLGILIPPSINLIVYGLLSETSVPQLYLAGFIPGVLLAGLFMLTVAFVCIIRPAWGGHAVKTSWRKRMLGLKHLFAPICIFAIVIGPIYIGWATPTEAASFGVLGAIFFAASQRRLSIDVLRQAIEGTMRTTAMIMLIVLAAMFLNFVLGAIGFTRELTQFVAGLSLGRLGTLLAIILFYIVLGCFMEVFAMLIVTTPLVVPVVVSLGYDPVWFGIVLIVLLEMALITPPVGLNLFVVQSVRAGGGIQDVMIGSVPFLITMVVMIALLIMFPGIALWLPSQFR